MKVRKHVYALAFATIGLGISCLFFDGLSYLPLIYGLCGGLFAGYFFAGLLGAKSKLLQKDFQKLGDVRGMSIEEICSEVGMYSSSAKCNISDRENEVGKLYTWTQNHYQISLLFDADGKCLGVTNEIEA